MLTSIWRELWRTKAYFKGVTGICVLPVENGHLIYRVFLAVLGVSLQLCFLTLSGLADIGDRGRVDGPVSKTGVDFI